MLFVVNTLEIADGSWRFVQFIAELLVKNVVKIKMI